MTKLNSPLSWYGGKYRMVDLLLTEILAIPHKTYVEGFGGAGHVILNKPMGQVDVYNDLHGGLVNFFTVLREQPDELQRILALTPYSRQEFTACLDWANAPTPLEKARRFYVVVRQSFGSKQETWSHARTTIRRGMSATVSKWLTNIEVKMPAVVARLRQLQVENLDFTDLINRYDTPDTLFYLDPPYVPSTRVALNAYTHEMTYADHERLIDILKNIKGKAVLSGYENELYNSLGWAKKVLYSNVAGSSSINSDKPVLTEMIWLKA